MQRATASLSTNITSFDMVQDRATTLTELFLGMDEQFSAVLGLKKFTDIFVLCHVQFE